MTKSTWCNRISRAAELTPLQSAFCEALVENGGDRTAALEEAGYRGANHRQRAHAMLKSRAVLDYIQHLTARRLATAAPHALATMIRLLSAKSEFVQQAAAADLLNRAGFKPPDSRQHVVAGNITIDIDLGE